MRNYLGFIALAVWFFGFLRWLQLLRLHIISRYGAFWRNGRFVKKLRIYKDDRENKNSSGQV